MRIVINDIDLGTQYRVLALLPGTGCITLGLRLELESFSGIWVGWGMGELQTGLQKIGNRVKYLFGS